MLKKTILNNWNTDIPGNMQIIPDLRDTDYPAWTVSLDGSYGVAIPYSGIDDINENFSGAKIRSTSLRFEAGEIKRVLLLTSEDENIKLSFATLCEAFTEPGDDGKLRRRIENSPVSWWSEWKELLGNRNVDERIYDVLGELCALLYLVRKGENAKWNGPDGASYDIETDIRFAEVKSTVSRSKREVSINSQFQLFPVEKPLDLILCVFEPAAFTGTSIDDILSKFDEIGFNTNILNDTLESLGFEKGMSARKKRFILHEMLMYKVDDSFPRISPESFAGGVLPKGITKITYTVDLSGLPAKSLMQGEPDA